MLSRLGKKHELISKHGLLWVHELFSMRTMQGVHELLVFHACVNCMNWSIDTGYQACMNCESLAPYCTPMNW